MIKYKTFVKYLEVTDDLRRMYKMHDPTELIESAYTDYADAIFRHCYLRVSNREVGKDIMQDAFIKAYQYAQKGEKIDNIRALLYKIANNLIIDYFRKAKETSLEALNEAGFDPKGSDGNDFGKALDEETIVRTLAKLRPEDRELIIMRYIDDLKPRDIALILGLAPNTVSVRIHRAIKELEPHLKNPHEVRP